MKVLSSRFVLFLSIICISSPAKYYHYYYLAGEEMQIIERNKTKQAVVIWNVFVHLSSANIR